MSFSEFAPFCFITIFKTPTSNPGTTIFAMFAIELKTNTIQKKNKKSVLEPNNATHYATKEYIAALPNSRSHKEFQ